MTPQRRQWLHPGKSGTCCLCKAFVLDLLVMLYARMGCSPVGLPIVVVAAPMAICTPLSK